MQFNIMWSGIEYRSLENCVAHFHDSAASIRSTIVGTYEGKIYSLGYRLTTDERGHTRSLELKFQGNDKIRQHQLTADGNGNWKLNGQTARAFDGCIDVDIALTPFTNTLPIRRLGLESGGSAEISVLYCDLLNDQLKSVRQYYRRLSPTQYHYENVPNDFEANIVVDEAGLVVDYPQLFVRTNILQASYPELSTAL